MKMDKERVYDIESAVIGRLGGQPHFFSFELSAPSFQEAEKRAEYQAIEMYYDEGGQGDDPQVVQLKIDGETV